MHEWKSYWFMIAGAQGLLLSIGLAVRSRKTPAPLFCLAVLLGVLSVELLTNFAVSIHYTNRPGAVPFWILGSYLLIPASLYLLARHSVGLLSPPKKYIVLLYLPAALEILTEATMAVLRVFKLPVIRLQGIMTWFIFTEIIPVLATLAVLGWWALSIKKNSTINRKKTTIPVRIRFGGNLQHALFIYYTTLSLLWLVEAFFQVSLSGVLEQLLAASLIVLGYIAFLHTGSFDKLSFTSPKPASLWNYDDRETLDKLLLLFEAGRVHCRTRLSVDDLAKSLHVPSRYISYLVSSHLQTTTTALINKYRVEEVMQKLKDPAFQNQTILSLAYESGFNSKSAFNQVFKAHTGLSPSQYLQKRS